MKVKERFRHIAAILLTGIFLMQSFIFLVPDEPEVLCIAEDHIAIESSAGQASHQKIVYAVSGQAHSQAIQNSGVHPSPDCTDIPLFTRVVKRNRTESVKPSVHISDTFSAPKDQSIHRYPDHNPVHLTGTQLLSDRERQYPKGIVSLLL